MDKENPYELCLEVLQTLNKEGALQHSILVGSWSLYFYQYYFNDPEGLSMLRTRDVDFAFPLPIRVQHEVDLTEVFKDKGFVLDFSSEGWVRFAHHPARFGLHKLIVSTRRKDKEKQARDRDQGVMVLRIARENKMDGLFEICTKPCQNVRRALLRKLLILLGPKISKNCYCIRC